MENVCKLHSKPGQFVVVPLLLYRKVNGKVTLFLAEEAPGKPKLAGGQFQQT